MARLQPRELEIVVEPDAILRALRAALEAAQQRRDAASERFEEIIREDSSHDIKQASLEYTSSRQDVVTALLKINDYLFHGKIPPELEGLEPKPAPKELSDPTGKKTGSDST